MCCRMRSSCKCHAIDTFTYSNGRKTFTWIFAPLVRHVYEREMVYVYVYGYGALCAASNTNRVLTKIYAHMLHVRECLLNLFSLGGCLWSWCWILDGDTIPMLCTAQTTTIFPLHCTVVFSKHFPFSQTYHIPSRIFLCIGSFFYRKTFILEQAITELSETNRAERLDQPRWTEVTCGSLMFEKCIRCIRYIWVRAANMKKNPLDSMKRGSRIEKLISRGEKHIY